MGLWKQLEINGWAVKLYRNIEAKQNIEGCVVQLVNEHELANMDTQLAELHGLIPEKNILLVTVLISKWNEQLTPWKADNIFAGQSFGAGAQDTLNFLQNELLPKLNDEIGQTDVRYYLAGYSLAGLFALWTGYQTDLFEGIAAMSPSVWYPGWDDYMEQHEMKAGKVYLSLGDKEDRTKHPVLREVSSRIKMQEMKLKQSGKECILEWNAGNHFMDGERRIARGIAWIV